MREEADRAELPWVLFVSFASPHFPLVVPQQYLDLYPLERFRMPIQYSLNERPKHPVLDEMRRVKRHEYNHGLWFKGTMYEGSVGIPLIISGPGVPGGVEVETPVSLIDCYPTIIEAVGAQSYEEDDELPGKSLFKIAAGASNPQRVVFSEYHGAGSVTGMFMIRCGKYKYVYYAGGYKPQLFDLSDDPDELADLADLPEYSPVLQNCERVLRTIVDPDAADAEAKADQLRRIEEHGGREAISRGGPRIAFSPAPEKFSNH